MCLDEKRRLFGLKVSLKSSCELRLQILRRKAPEEAAAAASASSSGGDKGAGGSGGGKS